MWRSNKLGIKEKISRGKFPRLISVCRGTRSVLRSRLGLEHQRRYGDRCDGGGSPEEAGIRRGVQVPQQAGGCDGLL